MHTILLRTLVIVVVAAAMPQTGAAQSSVRRTPKKEATEASGTPADKAKAKDPKTTKAKSSSTPAKSATAKTTAAQKSPATGAKTTGPASASVTRRTTPKKGTASAASPVDEATLRSQRFDEYQKREERDTPWQRTIYRELDVTRGSNASLYYPIEPTDGLTNFFRVILDLVVTGKVTAYEYLDGREVFAEKYAVKAKDVLDKYQILYVETPATSKTPATFTIDESDVPCDEVLSYFVKERWEFDNTTSSYGPRVLAICPVLHRAGDFGGEPFKYPLFWLRYEDLRPYLRKQLIVSDGMNAAPRFTMEDFFALQQYDGDIYKVQNLRGLSLMQQYPNPDTLRMARARIESELSGFRDSIWLRELPPDDLAMNRKKKTRASVAADTITVAPTDKTKRNRRTKATVDVGAAEARQAAQREAVEAEAERTGKAHSVRRTRR